MKSRQKQFYFNDDDVCVNPNVIHREAENPYGSFAIKTAQVGRRKWIVGINVTIVGIGEGMPCSKNSKQYFKTEREAIEYACNHIDEYLKKHRFGTSPNIADKTIRLYNDVLLVELYKVRKPEPITHSLFNCNNIECLRKNDCALYNPYMVCDDLADGNGNDCTFFEPNKYVIR